MQLVKADNVRLKESSIKLKFKLKQLMQLTTKQAAKYDKQYASAEVLSPYITTGVGDDDPNNEG